MAAELAPETSASTRSIPVMGVTGLLEQFMGMPDTPANRAKFLATIPIGRFGGRRSTSRAPPSISPADDAEFITGVELPVDGGRTV